ncbi:hypothetical protein F1Q36_05960 [Campylobacter coli]|nr:hypothetical protein [Campylobacter coli]
MKYKTIVFSILAIIFSACSTHQEQNVFYQQNLFSQTCNKQFFQEQQEKNSQNKDMIFTGLNTGYIARDCKDFNLSNSIFDKVEDSYKYDVDLQSLSKKSTRALASTLINEGVNDYQGAWYERTMLNVYKGLNFMSLGDFVNARVEFNRALMRQEKAKEYFASEIKKAYQEASKEEKLRQNIDNNIKIVSKQYENLFKDFNAQKDYTNPYVTYISSIFFFMDYDYKKAADLLKEVYVLNLNKEIEKEFKIFDQYSSSLNPKKLKKYIFIIYENGLSPALDEFNLTLPFIFDDYITTASVALPILKKRNASYENLNIANNHQKFITSNAFDFDQIVASEFKANLTSIIIKSLISSTLKTSLNMAVAKNDESGILSLATNIFSIATTRSDLRFWNFLPKNIQIMMIENDGSVQIYDDKNQKIYSSEVDIDKNVLIVVRSFASQFPARVYKIEN